MIVGDLKKMRSILLQPTEQWANRSDNVDYFLPLGTEELPLNQFLGKYIKLELVNGIHCQHCGRRTNKSFSQGYCFPCMRKLAQCDLCIMKPETCHYHEGTCREPEWGEKNCFTPHYVYLSNTSGLKVGITRHTQIPTRWIDQGATQGTIIYKVSTRRQSGLVEVLFKDLIADKTNWRVMLRENQPNRELMQEGDALKLSLADKIARLIGDVASNDIEPQCSEVIQINYPVLEFPSKIKSHNFDKNALVEGTLLGIKGQYLILDTGVINIRKFTSYNVSVSF